MTSIHIEKDYINVTVVFPIQAAKPRYHDTEKIAEGKFVRYSNIDSLQARMFQ